MRNKMSRHEIIAKIRRLVMVFLMLFPCIPKAVLAKSPPVPPVTFPFDVSRQGSTVDQEFRIKEYRSWYFALQFDHFGGADSYRVLALVGRGGRGSDGSYAEPGVIVPIHMKITKLEAGKDPETVYEGTSRTAALYAGVRGALLRDIIIIDLKPGIYRVEARTVQDSPEFSGTPSHLKIEYEPNLKFIPNTNNSKVVPLNQ